MTQRPTHRQRDVRKGVTRRSFLQTTTTAVGVAPLLGPRLFHSSPAETLKVACVGVGGMGSSDLRNVARGKNVTIVALCDVDRKNLDRASLTQPKARLFRDYRKMFDVMAKDIDAVTVSTPDHMHGSIAIAALSLGKHVYCQKPVMYYRSLWSP